MNQSVVEVLKNLPDEQIYYRSNPGNAGDSLIAAGAFQLFDSLNLRIKFIDTDEFDSSDKIVIYAGGGNLNHIYDDARLFIEKVHAQAKYFILLPHTVTGNENLLSEMSDNCTIFAREEISYRHIQKFGFNCKTYIDHDMALHLDVGKVLKHRYPNMLLLVIKKLINKAVGNNLNQKIPSVSKLLNVMLFEVKSRFTLDVALGKFFRVDVESSGKKIPPNNADLSVIYEFGTQSREIIDYTVWKLLRFINRFDNIQTDRLHISVGSALLGKNIEFYPNSYFKCKAVYEFSLKAERFSTIKWKGEENVDGDV